MLSIATWNINSVRLRMPQVARFLTEQAPDILCLQEIKTVEELFPHQAFEDLGYTYRAVHGQKGYHGVATVSRIPLREFSRYDWQANGEARHVGVELTDSGLVLENVYIPAGGDVADRAVNAKFGQKLDFFERMTRWADKLDRPMRGGLVGQLGRGPGVVEPPSLVFLAPPRTIAPPRIVAPRRGDVLATRSTQPWASRNRASVSISCGVWLTTLSSAL